MPERREINLPDAEQQERMFREVVDPHEPEHVTDLDSLPNLHPKSEIKESIGIYDMPKSERTPEYSDNLPVIPEKDRPKALSIMIHDGVSDPGAATELLAKFNEEQSGK